MLRRWDNSKGGWGELGGGGGYNSINIRLGAGRLVRLVHSSKHGYKYTIPPPPPHSNTGRPSLYSRFTFIQ
jgi:hypothetical protein